MYSIFQHLIVWALALALSLATAYGQTQLTTTPDASPKAVATQTIGLTAISVTYHRPAVKDRPIWGKLVPYNAVWRAGANDNTTISFSGGVKVEGQALPAGVYGLHMIPTENDWTVIFSHNSTSWGSFSYNEAEDALRVQVSPRKADAFHEFLSYSFEGLTPNSAECILQWGEKAIPFHIEVDVHQAVLTSLRQELQYKAGWSWQGWHEAANYCLQNDINQEEALAWASRSVFMSPNPQNMATKATLAGKIKGQGDSALETKIALNTLGKDLESMPCSWKEYNAAAMFALKKSQPEQALAWSQKAVAMSPNMTSMMAQSQILDKTGDKEGARKVKQDAIARGSNAELNGYGYQLLFSGKTADALEIFEANAEKNPEDPNVWDSLGEGYATVGEKEKAIKALKKSLSLNPPDNVRANSLKLLGQLGVDQEIPKP